MDFPKAPGPRPKAFSNDPDLRNHNRLRLRRRGKRAYIRSVHLIPSMATLGNAICGFGAIYVSHLGASPYGDPWTTELASHRFLSACYLILAAMLFDALDGRLARWARHTTDFGGQLDSMADVISFGAAPAMIALALFKEQVPNAPLFISRMVWAIGAVYMCCAAIRLARFNVSNEHGEQHHMSFLGLPSPGAAAAVIGLVLVHQELVLNMTSLPFLHYLADIAVGLLPPLTLASGLLMVSHFRYPHVVNKYLRGRRTIGRLVFALLGIVLLVTEHRYTIGITSIVYALSAPVTAACLWYGRPNRKAAPAQQ